MSDAEVTAAAAAELLGEAARELSRWGLTDLADDLRRAARRRVDDPAVVLVVGPPRSGKSSLVDALLGVRLLAGDPVVPTAVPVVVGWGARPSARFVPADGTSQVGPRPVLPRVPPDAVATAAGAPPAGVASVEVELPRALLAAGLVLVDTPGSGGGIAGPRAAAVLRAAADADAVVYAVDPARELGEQDVGLLRAVVDLCPEVVVVLTKTDAYREWRRIQALDSLHLGEAGLPVQVLATSAPLRVHGLATADDDALRASGFPQLADHLRRRVLGTRAAARDRQAARLVQHALRHLLAEARTRREALAGPGDPALVARWRAAREEAERLRTRSARWQQTLADQVAELAAQADADLTARLVDVRHESARRLESGDPTAGWREFEPWLYERTNDELLGHATHVRALADRVVADVAALFDAQVVELSRTLDLAVSAQPVSSALLRAPTARRGERADLGLHAVRGVSLGASLGVALAHGATLLAGAAISGPLLPVAAGVAAVLVGGRMLRSGREAQRRARRTEAQRAVTAYLDEVEVAARRATRDTVRRVQQEVRDHFTDVAGEMVRSADRSLRAVERAVRSARTERAGELRRLDDDLRRLRPLVAAADGLLAATAGATVAGT